MNGKTNGATDSIGKRHFEILRLQASSPSREALKWSLDSPRTGIPFESVEGGRFRIRGWVLADQGKPVHVAIRDGVLTRCYPLNELRADVVKQVLQSEPDGHPRLMCGFDLSFPVLPEITFGFESDATFWWLLKLRLADA